MEKLDDLLNHYDELLDIAFHQKKMLNDLNKKSKKLKDEIKTPKSHYTADEAKNINWKDVKFK